MGRSSKGQGPGARPIAETAAVRSESARRNGDSRVATHEVLLAIERAAQARMDPSTLIERAQGGDATAMGELYVEYFGAVRRYLHLTLKNADDASEIAQDVFERALKELPRYDASRGSFVNWILQIASRMAIDHLRRERRRRELDPRDLPSDGVSLLQRETTLVEQLDPDAGLRSLIDSLPPAQKRAVTLRFVFDFTAAEIADVLGCTDDAVRHLQHRALKTLAAALPPA
jgi:RNA polymerase sigma-70 factor (ECF subfamily)